MNSQRKSSFCSNDMGWHFREWKLSVNDPHDRDTWRSGVRSGRHAASQLPGRGPTVVDIAPCTCTLIKKN